MLVALLMLVNLILCGQSFKIGNNQNLFNLAVKNAGRNKNRSLAVVALLALGTFSVIITGANKKSFYGSENLRESGTGGFLYWSESALPLLHDLNTDVGKTKYGLNDEKALDSVHFLQFHKFEGDDASCLNLNQVKTPGILGIHPEYFDSTGSFSFDKIYDGINSQNTWLELNKNSSDYIIPAIADQTVIQWGLMLKVGDTLTYLNEFGEELKLVLIAGLSSSVFQGNILIADKFFRQHFPTIGGSQIMLVDGQLVQKDEIEQVLNNYLKDYGIELTLASEKLAEFNSVTNTYLSVFMVLGSLGIIIGTIGLGLVILRNMLERKREMALLQATGFRKKQLFSMVLTENLILLIVGLLIGLISATIGVLPSLSSSVNSFPYSFILVLIVIIFISGLAWIYFPVKSAFKRNLIHDLRYE